MSESMLRVIWWVVLPVLLIAWGVVGTLLQHRRTKEALTLMRTYATQGKEPPPDLLKSLDVSGSDLWFGGSGGWGWNSQRQAWQAAIIFACLAIAFWLWGLLDPQTWGHHRNGQYVVALMMGAGTVACVLTALLWNKLREK